MVQHHFICELEIPEASLEEPNAKALVVEVLVIQRLEVAGFDEVKESREQDVFVLGEVYRLAADQSLKLTIRYSNEGVFVRWLVISD